MKRWMLLALCVAAVMGSVRAVSMSWDDPSLEWKSIDEAAGSTSKGSANVHLSKKAFTVSLTMTISGFNPSSWAGGRWPNFLQIGDSTKAGDLSVCTDSGSYVRVTGDVATKVSKQDKYGPSDMKVTNGQHTIVLTYEDGLVKVYWDSRLAVAFEAEQKFGSDITKLHWGERHDSYDTTTDVDDSMKWQVDELKYLSDQVVVPEPTALALLALGVAGMALRRRAA